MLSETPIYIVCIDETKLTYDFPDAQFAIEGYKFPPYRRDRDSEKMQSFGGGKTVYIKDGLIAKRLEDYETATAETICVLNISNKKWFIVYAYRPESKKLK